PPARRWRRPRSWIASAGSPRRRGRTSWTTFGSRSSRSAAPRRRAPTRPWGTEPDTNRPCRGRAPEADMSQGNRREDYVDVRDRGYKAMMRGELDLANRHFLEGVEIARELADDDPDLVDG